tara:strand:- start:7430 stop:8725 length:1296 start_codon:yes stop_codon:yes gene_type:complete
MAIGDEKFTGVTSVNDYLLISNIENNLKSFLDWGFLNIGGFINVGATANTYNDSPNKLAYVKDPNYDDGQVWQTKYHDWVYDSVTFGSSAPTVPTSVYTEDFETTFTVTVSGGKFFLNGVSAPLIKLYAGFKYRFDVSDSTNTGYKLRFSETDDGTHGGGSVYTTGVTASGTPGQAGATVDITVSNNITGSFYYFCENNALAGNEINVVNYMLDFVNSRVIYDEFVDSYLTKNIYMNYSYRWVQVHKASSNLVWWKQYQNDVVNDITQFNTNTGEYAVFAQNRIQLPSIIIETVPKGTSKPYRLGDKSLVSDQDIILHVIANSPAHRNSIVDIIRLQEDKVIWLYDTNKLVTEGVLPFNFNGSLNSSRKAYNDLIMDCTEPDPVTGEITCEEEYRWKTCYLKDFEVSEVESRYFFEEAKIRITAEIIFDDM